MAAPQPEISVVIPVFNEAPNVKAVVQRTVAALEPVGRSFEIVMVDDGSTDESLAVLKAMQAEEPRLRIVRLMRNFGQTPAIYAGLAHARGAYIATIDADLQNPPEELPRFIEKLDEGYDVVQGWREIRQDSRFRKLASKAVNAIVRWFTKVNMRDLGCGMKAYRREVTEQMLRFTHHARYVPAEIVWLGVNMAEIRVEHNERAAGTSKYGIWSLLWINFNMIASVTTAPIRLIGAAGWMLALVGLSMGALIFAKRVIYGNFNPFVSITALFFIIAGGQMIATGLMCEYISRIFVEVQRKPYYIVKEVIE